jgi:hypothetical protein
MKCTVELDSGAMIYMPSYVKIGSGIEKLIGCGGDVETHRQRGLRINLLFFLIRKVC